MKLNLLGWAAGPHDAVQVGVWTVEWHFRGTPEPHTTVVMADLPGSMREDHPVLKQKVSIQETGTGRQAFWIEIDRYAPVGLD